MKLDVKRDRNLLTASYRLTQGSGWKDASCICHARTKLWSFSSGLSPNPSFLPSIPSWQQSQQLLSQLFTELSFTVCLLVPTLFLNWS